MNFTQDKGEMCQILAAYIASLEYQKLDGTHSLILTMTLIYQNAKIMYLNIISFKIHINILTLDSQLFLV